MATKRLARFNAVAVFERVEHALQALETLADSGLQAEELSLLGPEHEMRPGTGSVTEETADSTSGIGKAAATGTVVGGAAGGVLGALIGAAATAIPGVGLAVGAGAIYAAVAGATTGHVAGGLLGAQAGARKSMMWEQTLHPLVALVDEQGYVLLGVHSDDEERVDLGMQVLRRFQPRDLHRLDAEESFVPPGDVSAVVGRSIPSSHPDHPGAALGRDAVEWDDARKLGTELRPKEGSMPPRESPPE
ncbi:MAG: hypothetical protein ABR592_02505 [Nitriliruptorales bacterium]